MYMSAAVNSSSNAMPPSKRRFVAIPTERSDACSVREANAVPTWQVTIPANVAVVA